MNHIVRITDLIKILEENRKNHRDIFDEAVENYRKYAVKVLESHIEEIKSKHLKKVNVSLPVPEDHTEDYDRAIRMLKLSLNAGEITIELDDFEAAQFVQDDWNWRRAWVENTLSYTK